MTEPSFSIAVFPFLKTSGPVTIGGHTFRSTEDIADLPPEQAKAVTDISQMLFAQGDFRVKSASYAIIPPLDLERPSATIDQLAHLRAVLAYIYSSPHEIFESLFLTPEEISLALLTPGPVSVFLVRPERHTERVAAVSGPAPDKHHYVPGYRGLYNFQHYFWVERGSRLYSPKPHMTLNISQDLKIDLELRFSSRLDYKLLLALLEKSLTPTRARIHTALHWFNAANEASAHPDQAVLNLAVAFEALLRLPESSKTERLVDAITLLLGRTERLDDWAKQFYKARSEVAHEGRTQDPYFYVPTERRIKQLAGLHGSLMLYGRQVFQLCLASLLVGIDLADRADLREKLVSNNERYQKICDLLKSETDPPAQKLLGLKPILEALQRYQFITSGGVLRKTVISAVHYTAKTLIATGQPLPQYIADALAKVKAIRGEDAEFKQLALIKDLAEAFEAVKSSNLTPEASIACNVVKIAWMGLFEIYYWLSDRNESDTRDPSHPA